jgi:hypothetical protein
MTATRRVAAPAGVMAVSVSMSATGRKGGPRRMPGRPAWTRDAFLAAWSEACRVTPGLPGHKRWADLAANFRRLDGSVGIDERQLRRLHVTFDRPTQE